MNFLKISGLVLGASSVVGGTGTAIYYAKNKKTKFEGKLVFLKKQGTGESAIYEVKLIDTNQYKSEQDAFNNGKTDTNTKYDKVNKIVDLSNELNIQQTKAILKEIFGNETTLQNAKAKVSTEKITDLKELFGEKIYESLKTALEA